MSSDTRSPSYPQMSLPKALDLTAKLYEGVHRAAVGNAEAQQIMGYAPRSGSALAALSALKRFGLMEGRDPQIKLTPLALKILEPLDARERAEGIAEAAQKPEMFAEVMASFGGRVPADSAIRAKLVREKHFTSAGADAFIRSFKETFAFAEREAGHLRQADVVADEDAYEIEAELPVSAGLRASPVPVHALPAATAHEEILSFRVSPRTSVTVRFDVKPLRNDVQALAKLLEVLSNGYPESDPT